MKSLWYDGGISVKSNTRVKIEIEITPKANIQKYLSHRLGRSPVLAGLVFTTTLYRLIFFRSSTMPEQNAPLSNQCTNSSV